MIFTSTLCYSHSLFCLKNLNSELNEKRKKTGKKKGAQPGHPHHPRRSMKPDKVAAIPTEERLKDSSRYIPTGNTISRQVIGITVVPVVTEYRAEEFHDKKITIYVNERPGF